jgi:hypothetical protein
MSSVARGETPAWHCMLLIPFKEFDFSFNQRKMNPFRLLVSTLCAVERMQGRRMIASDGVGSRQQAPCLLAGLVVSTMISIACLTVFHVLDQQLCRGYGHRCSRACIALV